MPAVIARSDSDVAISMPNATPSLTGTEDRS
jgi:hypothetical protein